jgi:hypothetical protein
MQAVSDFSSVFSALSVSERKPYRSFMNNPGYGEICPREAPGKASGATRAATRGIHPANPREKGRLPVGGMTDSGDAEQSLGEGEMGPGDAGGGL